MIRFLLPLSFLFCFAAKAATITVINTNDSGAGSFRQAVADANMGDIIRFDPALISGGSATILFETPVLINKGLFFNGLYNATDTLFFSGGNTSSIFNIVIPNSITYPHIDMDSLVFIDGNGANNTYGGAIKINNGLFIPTVSNMYIRNCVFRNNTAPYGGAIGSFRDEGSTAYCQKIYMEIYNTTFKSNTATGAGSDGGAIYLHRKRTGDTNDEPRIDLTINRSNFINNSCDDKGGAIYVYAESYQSNKVGKAYITITESTLDNNHCTTAGGAIYVYTTDSFAQQDSETILTLKSSTITNNSVVTNGGALYLWSSNTNDLDIDACTVMDNTALNDGSAIYQKTTSSSGVEAEIIMTSCIVMGNAGNFNYDNTIYQESAYDPYFIAADNIFDSEAVDFQYGLMIEDDNVFSATVSQVNLLPLAINGRNTYTRIPDEGSIAINAGNSSHTYDAQNGPLLGIRDVGAAESPYCTAIPFAVSQTICEGSTYDFYGQDVSSAGTYNHTIVTPGACDTIVTLTLNTETPVVPDIFITANPGNTIMIGTPVTITAVVQNGGTTPSFQWYADGSPVGPNAAGVTINNLFDGVDLMCVVTSNDACVSSDTAHSNTITFTVHPNNDEPCNGISLPVNPTCVESYFANHIATQTSNVGPHDCATSTSKDIWFKFVAPASGNVEIYTYAGTLTDAVMSVYLGPDCSSLFEVGCIDDDGTNQMPQGMVTGATPGTTYYIRVSSYGTTASGNFAICVVDQGTNSLEEQSKQVFSLYPNPNDGNFNLVFKEVKQRDLKVFSSVGTLIYEGSTNSSQEVISLDQVESGIYFVEVTEGQNRFVQKITIEK